MGSKYELSEAAIREIEKVQKENKNKRAEAGLKASALRAKEISPDGVFGKDRISSHSITTLTKKYREGGSEAISGNHYDGNRRNMSKEEAAAIPTPFKERAGKGESVDVSVIKAAYRAAASHPIGSGQNELFAFCNNLLNKNEWGGERA